MLLISNIQSLRIRRIFPQVFVLLVLLLAAPGIWAQDNAAESGAASEQVIRAPVIVDGKLVAQVRGVSSYPASVRAKEIRDRIVEVARDDSFSVDKLTIVTDEEKSAIMAGDIRLLVVFDKDAEMENLNRKLLAEVIKVKIATVVTEYRNDRSLNVLLQHAAYALGLTAIFALIFWGVLRVFRGLNAWAVRHVQKGVQDLASKSHHLIQAEQIWTLVAGLLSALRVLTLAVLVYSYLNSALGLFPWTRPVAVILFDLVLNPVKSLWYGFVASLPDLAFLAVLYLILRYILKLQRMFFKQVALGRIKLQNFDADWAMPTHRIIRFMTIAFAIVIAYPYIPGSDSMAFKGVSVFIGVIFSLGSSSFIANVMAGLAMTYRGAFKEGDRVKIDEVFGRVEEIKLMTTRIQTLKNESVLIPNSNILNTNVTNYTVMAEKPGLVLYSTVGIGYDTPWRQVEAMLLLAAKRTEGLQQEPSPFVLQTLMGDFAVNYEINAYCRDVSRMMAIKTDLHRNIQDVFNEYGVQIMSPAYESDPQTLKVVPPENWYAAPASKPAEK
jgi:small-conductance mechanosensitive channel